MKFNRLDLNLLVALNALLTERNITRAATRVHLSQPAMSNVLSRLRAYFDDPLLVASGRQMLLTPRAESLVDPVREVLMRIDSTIATHPSFDPSKASKRFTLLVSDFTTAVFVPPLLRRLYEVAPGIGLDLRMQASDPATAIERGDGDLLIIPSQYVSPEHPAQPLFEEDYVCVTWSGNRHISGSLTFDDYLACGHVIANYSSNQRVSAFDAWFLDRFQVKRRVEVTAPALAALPSMVIGTDRIATVHRRLATQAARGGLPIVIWELPLEAPKLIQMVQWHKYRSKDPALQWLLQVSTEVGLSI